MMPYEMVVVAWDVLALALMGLWHALPLPRKGRALLCNGTALAWSAGLLAALTWSLRAVVVGE